MESLSSHSDSSTPFSLRSVNICFNLYLYFTLLLYTFPVSFLPYFSHFPQASVMVVSSQKRT
ncbi:hypothetical protein L3Y34_003040 [Caenorhabditis briggsae]|uniref:Uncharacterized protein n=1 Tax=Caenorhabditis briggsae TaxID=6238 RepID=A0AAE9D364_CAEBR|nr:hypothetical protein L3Y34_003040 [Caenorhabditis briggsae]